MRQVRTRSIRTNMNRVSAETDIAIVEIERDGNEVVSVSHAAWSDMPGHGHHFSVLIAYRKATQGEGT